MCYLLLPLIQTAELLIRSQGLQAVSSRESTLKGTRPTFASPFILVTEGRKVWEGVYMCSRWKGNTDCQITIPLQFLLPIEFFNHIIFYCVCMGEVGDGDLD